MKYNSIEFPKQFLYMMTSVRNLTMPGEYISVAGHTFFVYLCARFYLPTIIAIYLVHR